jgi:hypothetical protein
MVHPQDVDQESLQIWRVDSADTGKKWEHNGTVHQLFIDFEKAHDSMSHSGQKYCTIFSLNLVCL